MTLNLTDSTARRVVLDFLQDVWEDEALRAAYRLDTPEAPLEAALQAWGDAGYPGGELADDVLHIVEEISPDAGPDCYPDLFAELAEVMP